MRLNAVSALDDVRLQRDGSRPVVQLEEQAASIAEHGAMLVAAPQGRGMSATVLAGGLGDGTFVVSHGRHCDVGAGMGRPEGHGVMVLFWSWEPDREWGNVTISSVMMWMRNADNHGIGLR